MTEAVLENQEADTTEADFAKGFSEARAEAPAPATEAAQTEAAPAKQEEKPAEQPTVEVKPTLIAGMTEADWNAAVAKAVDAEGIRNEIRKSFGQYGELKRTITELSTKLAAGAPASRKITAAMLKRVNEELPGLGDALAQDLSDVLGAAQAAEQTAVAQGKPFDPDAYFTDKLAPALEQLEARANERAEIRIVKSIHRDFDTVVKSPDFSAWLKTLPEAKQKEVRESEDGFVAADAVTEFKSYTDKQKKAKEQKNKRLESAVTPQGAARTEPVQQDEEASFTTGFQSAGRKYASR